MAAPGDIALAVKNGRKVVAAAGTPLALLAQSAASKCKWVIVTALNANTSPVAVGGAAVVAAAGTETGVVLGPGDAVTIAVSDVSLVFVDSRVNGEGVSFAYGDG